MGLKHRGQNDPSLGEMFEPFVKCLSSHMVTVTKVS